MMPNTTGLKRTAGPGRPKGSKDAVPKSFKASIKRVFEDLATDEPDLIRAAVLRGLRGRPRESFPYVQLAAHYIDGKPADTVKLESPHASPCVVVLPAGTVLPPRDPA
jgi:hypothetical protein